jgi:hypothetical protein
VRAYKVDLKLAEFVVRDIYIGERTESGVDPIYYLAAFYNPLDKATRPLDPFARRRGKRDLSAFGYRSSLLKR